jgi:hypothetical protein
MAMRPHPKPGNPHHSFIFLQDPVLPSATIVILVISSLGIVQSSFFMHVWFPPYVLQVLPNSSSRFYPVSIL